MKILIADRLSDIANRHLSRDGHEVDVQATWSTDDLVQNIDAGTQVLIVRSTKVTRAVIDAAPELRLVVRAGAGFNTIDVNHASQKGIYVANCPGKNADAVAELAIGLLVAVDRQIANATRDLRQGKWEKSRYGKAYGLKGRTLGLLGFGAIGQAVARRAIGMEMKVLAWSRSLTEDAASNFGVERAASPFCVAEQSDAVSVHLPLSESTHHFINEEFLNRMRDGCILLNTSRGELVDTAALRRAIETKSIKAGMDVFENEPTGGSAAFEDCDLASMVTCTPHIGASTDQTAEAIANEVVRIVREFESHGLPPGAVNMQQESPARCQMTVRHLNQVGVLAIVLDGLRTANINVQEMQNSIFDGATAASCSLRLDAVPATTWVNELVNRNAAILSVSVQQLD